MEDKDLLTRIKMSDQGSLLRVAEILKEYSIIHPEDGPLCISAVELLQRIHKEREQLSFENIYRKYKLCEGPLRNNSASEVIGKLIPILHECHYECEFKDYKFLINGIELIFTLEKDNLRLAAFCRNEEGEEKEVLKRKIPLHRQLDLVHLKQSIDELLTIQKRILSEKL